jgi:thermitase
MTRAGLPDAALARMLAEGGGGKARRIGKTDLRIVDLPAGAEKAMVERLSRNPHIKFAELDMRVSPSLTSNDPYLGSQWHIGKIGADAAWASTFGDNVTVAVLDTGVDASHPDLSASIVPGWNVFSNTSDTRDVYNHGTGVAGTMAAIINNATGVAGIAGRAKIMPIKISDDTGYASWSAMASGLTHAADRGVRVANISYPSAASASVQSAAQYMKGKGGLVFMSAGNSGAEATTTPTTSLIVVSATDNSDVKTSWSTYGGFVSLSAPGTGIYTTTLGGGYVPEAGTSFSSPVAAGVAALVMAANPALSSAQVEDILFKSAVDLGTAGRDKLYGYGRVDAAKAVSLALASSGTTKDTQAPTAQIMSPTGGASVSGLATVDIAASDNVGVSKVEFRVNGSLVATDSTAPYGFSWDTTRVANGTVSLDAMAYDAAGNVGRSSILSVNVANATTVNTTADTIAPVVGFLSPATGSTVATGLIRIEVAATDNAGTAGLAMTLRLGGKLVASSSGTGALAYNWNARKVKTGTYTFTAEARDMAGNLSAATLAVNR